MEVSYHAQTTPHWHFSNGLSQHPVVSRGSHPPIAIGTRIMLPHQEQLCWSQWRDTSVKRSWLQDLQKLMDLDYTWKEKRKPTKILRRSIRSHIRLDSYISIDLNCYSLLCKILGRFFRSIPLSIPCMDQCLSCWGRKSSLHLETHMQLALLIESFKLMPL